MQLCLYCDVSACVAIVTGLMMGKLMFMRYGHRALWYHIIMETGDGRTGSAELVLLLRKY